MKYPQHNEHQMKDSVDRTIVIYTNGTAITAISQMHLAEHKPENSRLAILIAENTKIMISTIDANVVATNRPFLMYPFRAMTRTAAVIQRKTFPIA